MKVGAFFISKGCQQKNLNIRRFSIIHDEASCYSTYSMTAPDRRKFESRFGRSANYRVEDIAKITYGKKYIYTAEQPEQEMQSSSGPVMTMGR